MKFEYDPDKSASNKAKHGVDFEEAQELWTDRKAVTVDLPPDRPEPRSMTIGFMRGHMWAAATTWRGDAVRLISVRRARDREILIYESYNQQ
jgi:uncharacterized DUF497 family protein